MIRQKEGKAFRFGALALTALLCFGQNAARAGEDADPSYLAIGLGYFDIIDGENEAAEFRVEYRSGWEFWFIKPFAGIMATTDEAVFGYAGIMIDVHLGQHLVISPSFAPGLYHDGEGKDLGHVVEFRSQIEVAYQFDDRSRLGLSLNHISNAGLDERNPGAESIAVTFAVPMERLLIW
jgi:hypothetical protein